MALYDFRPPPQTLAPILFFTLLLSFSPFESVSFYISRAMTGSLLKLLFSSLVAGAVSAHSFTGATYLANGTVLEGASAIQ